MNFKNLDIKKFFTRKNLIFVILIVVIAVGAVGIRNHAKNKKVETKQEIKNVKTQKITLGSISSNVEYAGSLKPAKEVIVLPKNGGKVASVKVNVGDKVTAGQVLYTLDTDELQASLQAQQAALDGANADLEKTSDSSQAQQVSQAEQTAGKAQVQFSSAEDNYNKMQKLYATGAVSKKELDDSKTQYDNDSIDLKTAQDNLSLLENKIGPQSTRSAAAKVEQSQAGVNTAQIQINGATITSPISGVVSAKDIEVGKIASSQSGSVTVIDSSTLTAEITVPDKMIAKIKVGQSVPVTINALDGKKITGVIDTISPDADSKNNCYTVKAKIDNANGDMNSGMFVKVSLEAESKDNVLSVPNQAIKTENGVDYIYLVENSKIKKVAVTTGISNDTFTEVSGNVKQSDDILTEGQSILADGEKVNKIN
jgi:multidrug efflux pump subunit AcrA (membrane-fusion protein)